MAKKISLAVPCYNEQEALPHFYDETIRVINNLQGKYDLEFEFVFVDDGSKDDTLMILKELSQKDDRVKYISFSRNFGKEAAIYASLENATGDYLAIMDADLQDPPQLLEDMYLGIVQEGYDCVGTRRTTRKNEPPIRSFFANLFYKMINKISKVEIVNGARDFRLMNRQMVDSILSINEYNRFSKGIFSWVGYKIKWLEYENVERVAGETKWSFWKLLIYAIDGIIAFSTAPLQMASILGIVFCLISVLMIVVIIVKTLVWGDPVAGYPSLICVIFLLGGLQLFTTGILGQYIAKTYLETKQRPIYIIKEVFGINQ